MSNAAHISGQNAPFTLPHSPALRGCNHCVVADAFTLSLHVGQQGDSALWMPALAGTRKPSTMRSMKRSSPWSLPCLSGHTLSGFSCAPSPRTRGPRFCGTSPLCFPDSSPKASLGPCSRKRGSALGAWPVAQASPMGDPANPGIQP